MAEYIKQIELVQNGDTKIIDIGTPNLVDSPYLELKELRDNGKLVPGVWYRITDYSCTLNESLAIPIKSANHFFDIVVLALSQRTLSEECFAMPRVADSYFTGCNLLSWKIWYCFDNDTQKYSWAHPNGRGVIYRMIDENGNDAPYDFKNILTSDGGVSKYTFNRTDNNTDLSLTHSCSNNVIKPYYTGGQYTLNNIILSSSSNIFNNLFDAGCYNIKLGDNATDNYFGGDCCNITLGDECANNVFGQGSKFVYMGSYCQNNIIGKDCEGVVFGSVGNSEQPIYKNGVLDNNKITAKNYYRGIKVDDTVSNISLDLETKTTTPSASKYLTNIHVHHGIYGGSRSEKGDGHFTYTVNTSNPIMMINVDRYSQPYELNISLDSLSNKASGLVMWYV